MALPLRGLTRDARRAKDIRRLDMRQFVLSSYVSGLMSYCLLVLLVSCLLSHVTNHHCPPAVVAEATSCFFFLEANKINPRMFR